MISCDIALPWWQNFWISTNLVLANMVVKTKILVNMYVTFLCMIALRNKTVAILFFHRSTIRMAVYVKKNCSNFAAMVT